MHGAWSAATQQHWDMLPSLPWLLGGRTQEPCRGSLKRGMLISQTSTQMTAITCALCQAVSSKP